ncbi:hypothetical protein J3459_008462 [Metarhizium acridum]|uniref:Uncharacterized protein n=1 Tax=Metarhizium acridum (strain CQMa 102) TaxID=655827 RepID=E9EFA0_METAQ|nr:uncharacterized protein MAC_08548 [Metarhizium acridum CQMa 102]EFY85416.1 hypothetical protein MAC_08548 [Metarhizium acridum CQMa 102]KAG8426060.1 hypothetical protein J3459_008462 [Metarhizium acridum]
MAESTYISEQQNASTPTTTKPCREEDGLMAIPYSETAECEPPVPMVPLKSPQRTPRDCSEESPPISPPSSSSSIYAGSAIPTILEMPQSVEEHSCALPSSMLQPMSASIYEVTWEDVFPVEEVMDEVTGLPIYIAPWIIRSESDEDDNRRMEDWTPPIVSASMKRQPADSQTAKKPAHKWKKGRDVEPLTIHPKKKRNFWMSFRRSKKAIAAAVAGSVASLEGNEGSQRGPQATPEPQRSVSQLGRKGTVREHREPGAVDAIASPAGEPDPAQSHPKSLVEVRHPVVSITQVDVPTPPTTPKNEELNSVMSAEMGHKINIAIPEAKLLNDELRARFCC